MNQSLSWLVANVLIAVLGIATPGMADEKKTEVEGAWKLVKGGQGAPKQITFTGNKFVLKFADDRAVEGTFTLKTNETPSEMDMKISKDSTEKYKGKVALCIYKFDGEKLTWCASIPGRKRRPPQFAEVMGDARLLLGTYSMIKE